MGISESERGDDEEEDDSCKEEPQFIESSYDLPEERSS